MAYSTTFNINQFFSKNYGLPDRPVLKKGKKKSFIVYLLFFWILIPLYIVKKAKYKKELTEWESALNYRINNWYKDYDKFYNDAFAKFELKKRAFEACDVVEEQTQLIKPFYIYGNNFSGYYRKYEDGTYRSQKMDYTYLIFTEKGVKIYRATLDLLNIEKIIDSNELFKYSKINTVRVSNVTYKGEKGISLDSKEGDETINFQALYLNVGGEKYEFSYFSNSETEKSIKAMKSLVDEMGE